MDGDKRRGFSLLELLTVIAIMSLLSMLAVTGYFGAVRGMARRSAVKHLVNTLTLARQRACLEGVRMSVLFFNETASYSGNKAEAAPSYVVCRELGRVSGRGSYGPYDEFTALDRMFDVVEGGPEDTEGSKQADENGVRRKMRLFNLNTGEWDRVRPKVKRVSAFAAAQTMLPKDMVEEVKYPYVYWFAGGRESWEVGDPYGIETTPVNSLPKGFYFREIGNENENVSDGSEEEGARKIRVITFEPDGAALKGETLTVVEKMSEKSVAVKVDRKGAISYNNW